jgi:hypothetical protein
MGWQLLRGGARVLTPWSAFPPRGGRIRVNVVLSGGAMALAQAIAFAGDLNDVGMVQEAVEW